MRIPKPRFGLAFAFAMMTVCTVCIGVGVRYWSAMRREQLAAQYLSTHGATIYYQGISEYPPKWFQRLVGQQDFENVTQVDLWGISLNKRTVGLASTGRSSDSRITLLQCDPKAVPLLRDLPQLRILCVRGLDGREFTPDDLRGLGRLPHLERLEIVSSEFDANCNYEFFQDFPSLEYLSFEYDDSRSAIGGSSLGTLLEQLPNLEVLVLSGANVTDDSLFGLRKCHDLQRLYINGGTITHQGLAHVPTEHLADLSLINCGLSDSAQLGETLSMFKALQFLVMERCEVGDQVFRNLDLPEVKLMHIVQTKMTINSLYAVGSLPQLRLIQQSANQITEAELEQFKHKSVVDVR